MITPKDIDNLADLARLELSPEEKAGFEQDLNNILGYVGEVQNIKAESVNTNPDSQTINGMRDDTVTTETGEYTESLVQAASDNDRNFVKVKKILG